MATTSPTILGYGLRKRRRRRYVAAVVLLSVLASPLFYWRLEMVRWSSRQYHIFLLRRAQRSAETLNVPAGHLAVDEPAPASGEPLDRNWADAWRRMTSEFEQAVWFSLPPTTNSNPAILPGFSDAGFTPLIIAPLVSKSGSKADVVVMAKADGLVTETWVPNASGAATDRDSWWNRQSSALTIEDISRRRRYFTGSIDAVSSARLRIACEIDGVRHRIIAEYHDDGSVGFSGESGWWDGNHLFVTYHGNFGRTALNEFNAVPIRFPMPDESSVPIVQRDGRLIVAGIEQWFVYPQAYGTTKPETRTAPRPDRTWRAPLRFSPSGDYLLAGSERDGWHVIETATRRIAFELPALQSPRHVSLFLSDDELIADDDFGVADQIDLKTGRHRNRLLEAPDTLVDVTGGRALVATVGHVGGDLNSRRQFAKLIDLRTGQVDASVPWEFGAATYDVRLSPDGNFIARAAEGDTYGGMVQIRSVANREVLFNGADLRNARSFDPVIWSADGRWALFSDMRYAYVLAAPRFDHCWRIALPSTITRPIGFSPDGRWLAAVSRRDTAAWVWELSPLVEELRRDQPAD